MKILLILLSYGLKPGWLLCIFMFWIFNQVENNFSWSLPLLTIKVTSKGTKLKWNQQLRVSGFIEKFWTFWGHRQGSFPWEFFFLLHRELLTSIFVETFWETTCVKRKTNCAITTSFSRPVLLSAIALDQSAQEIPV